MRSRRWMVWAALPAVGGVGWLAVMADEVPVDAAVAVTATAPADVVDMNADRTVADGMMAARAGVIGGVHDFSEASPRPVDACRACHVPHLLALKPRPVAVSPGLSDAVPATQPAAVAATQPAYAMYRITGQRAVFVPDRYTPGPTSLVCLGCHDGTVAASILGSAHAMLAGVREGFAMPGGQVWKDHPIGIPYPTGGHAYRPRSYVEAEGVRLPEGRLECISCHDPHNERGIPGMLVKSNKRSDLCLTCHIK